MNGKDLNFRILKMENQYDGEMEIKGSLKDDLNISVDEDLQNNVEENTSDNSVDQVKNWCIMILIGICMFIVILDLMAHLMIISVDTEKCSVQQKFPHQQYTQPPNHAFQKLNNQRQNMQKHVKMVSDYDQSTFKAVQYISEEYMADWKNQCKQKGEIVVKIKDLNQSNIKYKDIQKYSPFQQLPFCLLAFESEEIDFEILTQSIHNLNYSNHKSVFLSKTTQYQNIIPQIKVVPNYSYENIQNIVKNQCQQNSVIMLINEPLIPSALLYLNDMYQNYQIWMTYTIQDDKIKIYSFYQRVFHLLQNNDFQGFHQSQFQTEKSSTLALGLYELCQRHMKNIEREEIFRGDDTKVNSIFETALNVCVSKLRQPYQQLYSLSQDYPVEIDKLGLGWAKFNENRQRHYNGYMAPNDSNITQKKAFIAIENQQMLYFPTNHSLVKRQIEHYRDNYMMDIVTSQIPLCITVPSYKNAKQNRYQRAMLSILKQNYTNYHIVFLDDFSEDLTLQKTKQFLENANFPKQRVTYIQNLQRKYATYNIVHAAHSYCKEDSIQMMLDGDDRYIGNQVFKFFNFLYQSDPNLWVAYSTYISTYFTYGESHPIMADSLDNTDGGRKIGHYMGLQRSWYVKLLRQIPLKYHQHKNGQWLDVMSDDAIQYCLYELVGRKRMKYFAQINYYYTMNFNNNQIKKEKKVHRDQTHRQAMQLQRLRPLDNLSQQFQQNQEILQIFRNEKGIKFVEVQ